MIALGVSQTPLDEVHVALRRRDASLGFLLEGVQYIDGVAEPHRVDGAVGVAVEVFDKLDDPTPEAFSATLPMAGAVPSAPRTIRIRD
jgi:hypothetical protein